mmetsp:Transcript_11432/g.29023  ORF Transcript_11432/g.29023 Transcript_11432/m.29023 type:complete len:228 (+) Transcript_11432:202-885(+)
MCSPGKRREMDIMKLMMSDFNIDVENDSIQEFFVEFKGPKDSPYEGGVWKVHVELPEAYPYRSPSIGFVNRIFHPNVDEMYVGVPFRCTPQSPSPLITLFTCADLTILLLCRAGSVCLDVINQTWSPMFDLINVFEVFLPQLLLYPNPTDPLNGEAAALLMREPENYNKKVKEYVQRYALPEHVGALKNGSAGNQGSDDDDSGFDSDSGNSLMNSDDDDDEIANMDD